MVRRLIIATNNDGKLREISSFLKGEFDDFYFLKDFAEVVHVEEDGLTYLENALKKARKVGNRFEITALADDSGLEVEALNGRPGIYSSRYGKDDDERIKRLLADLKGVPWEKRRAVFKSCFAYYLPDIEKSYCFFGILKGYIGFERKGRGGFGFDPVFYVPELDRYLAEISIEEKNKISHRGRALSALKGFLNKDLFRAPRPLTQ